MNKVLFRKLSTTTASFALIALGNVAPAAAASLYSITELPFQPSDINNSGQIVGGQYLWNNGNLTDLNTLPGANGSLLNANAINNKGTIVGGGLNVESTGSTQAFIYNGNTVTELARNPASNNFTAPTSAFGINDAGQVGFNLILGGFEGRVDTYLRDNNSTVTQVLSDATGSAINNEGQVIGSLQARGRNGPGVGLLYDPANSTQTQRLIGPGYCNPFNPSTSGCFSPSTVAEDINEQSQVVGGGPVGTPSADASVHALLWTDPISDSVGTDLGTLGGSFSQANGINNFTQVVGTSSLDSGKTRHAFLWEKGESLDLNNLIGENSGWELTSAFDINNQGQIIGTGSFNGQDRGFVLAPVPEPSSTLGMLGFGTLGFGLWLKRRQQKLKLAETEINN